MSKLKNMDSEVKKSVVVIGGGTGIHPILRGLKSHRDHISIKAIISMADSGGSTGRLRDEFGQLPVGDVRMALTALSSDYDEHGELMRELFLHRFDKGDGLDGHNFGNILLVALTEILGSEAEAVKAAARILRVRGRVFPVTEDHLHIVAEYDDEVIIKGEHEIDEPAPDRYGHRITRLTTEPQGQISEDAKEAILGADLILIGPGDLYSSLLANLVIGGVSAAILQSGAKLVFAANLMTRPGQTDDMSACDHAREIEKYVGKRPDVVIVNTGEVPEHLLKKYAEKDQYPVRDDCDAYEAEIIRADLLDKSEVVKPKGDVLERSLVRGDGDKFAKLLLELLE